ncbi:uncharacterized protein PAC_15831 [Phialocephala subalpina]|uniref:Xylanolytic transcriptional activator regulatory domain-containing protein n=1 Tax=Phialocephala subalpina TaxID=576137 RepID=A0A1L7XLJ7_9HELO|nr:uncharacterized protein PAC_15831 [Phialocephala subalpina]
MSVSYGHALTAAAAEKPRSFESNHIRSSPHLDHHQLPKKLRARKRVEEIPQPFPNYGHRPAVSPEGYNGNLITSFHSSANSSTSEPLINSRRQNNSHNESRRTQFGIGDNSAFSQADLSSDHDQPPPTVVYEEDAYLRICQAMANGSALSPSESPSTQASQSREIVEYHEGTDSISILSGVIGQTRQKKLVRLVVSEPQSSCQFPTPERTNEEQPSVKYGSHDNADIQFLSKKGVFDLPPRSVCEEMLEIYFESVYPYAPIFDRQEFWQAFRDNTYSIFLMQALLGSVVPYASSELLFRLGFSDRLTAQKSLFTKATLLYDFGFEERQLQLLQGSLLLSSLQFSITTDKDYRFWLHNAIRIATRMGLHRANIVEDLDSATYKLYRRIWWVIFTRAILLSISGVQNIRLVSSEDCDTTILTEDDWDIEVIGEGFKNSLSPITRPQKLFLIYNCRLAGIGDQFLRAFRSPGLEPAGIRRENLSMENLASSFSTWRESLPIELQIGKVGEWSRDSIWILVLMAMSYRLECLFYHALREQYKSAGDERLSTAVERLHLAMFEIDTIVGRVMLYKKWNLCPLSLGTDAESSATCAATVVALHIETALDPNASRIQRSISQSRIQSGFLYLREAEKSWTSVKWSVKLFEGVLSHLRMSVEGDIEGGSSTAAYNPIYQAPEDEIPRLSDDPTLASFSNVNNWDEFIDSEGWVQDLLGFDFSRSF